MPAIVFSLFFRSRSKTGHQPKFLVRFRFPSFSLSKVSSKGQPCSWRTGILGVWSICLCAFFLAFSYLESYIKVIRILEIRVEDLPWHTSFFSQRIYINFLLIWLKHLYTSMLPAASSFPWSRIESTVIWVRYHPSSAPTLRTPANMFFVAHLSVQLWRFFILTDPYIL